MNLTRIERDFVAKVVPICSTISHWSSEKHAFIKRPANRLYPVVVLVHIIIESQWGTHPLSQYECNKRKANNLALLTVDDLWQGKHIKYENKEYKSYESWIHFATDYSDLVVFSNNHLNRLVKESDIKGQIKQLASISQHPVIYAAKAEALIETHSLDKLFTKNFR